MTSRMNLNALYVASPCPMSWDAMRGTDQARFCDRCQKNVYNFAAMTTEEGLSLIAQTEGEFCGRLTRRADGMLMTADCPVGLAARLHRFRRRLVYSTIAASFMFFGFIGSRQSQGESTTNSHAMITAMLNDWLEQLKEWAGYPSRRNVVTMGGCPGPPPGQNVATTSSK